MCGIRRLFYFDPIHLNIDFFTINDHFYFTFVTVLLANFKKHIDAHFSFLKGKKILVAISGGLDSVVLTHLLEMSRFDISLAHCNFRLRRNESDEDQLFVKDVADQIKVPFYTIAFDTSSYANEKGCSTQMAARELRYDWFEKIRIENNLDYIATAHHLDDNLETFLINFTRGTGLNGLTGIPAINNEIIRPLLPFSREKIEGFAEEKNIEWREDASNAKTAYQRNKLRHKVIPVLKKMNPNLLSSFQNTTSYLKESQDIIDDAVSKVKKELIIPAPTGLQKINIKKLKEFRNPKAYLFELLKGYGFTEWNDVENLLESQSGKKIYSQTHRLIKDRDHFLLEPNISHDKTTGFLIHEKQDALILKNFMLRLTESDTHKFEEMKNAVQINGDLLHFPLELRKWKAGDYFYPFGMTGKKKISKFFKDEKLSLIDKENTWLLCSKDEIIWVVNRRLDERFKVTANTKKTIRIEYIEN